MNHNEGTTRKHGGYRFLMWGFIALATLWWIRIITAERFDRHSCIMAVAETLIAAGFIAVVVRQRWVP